MAEKPNLIFVFADQLRYQSCSFAGDSRAQMPSIDQLATSGTSFCNATSSHPLCAPYRASLLTGKFSSSTGMAINELRLNPNQECFGHVLSRKGYGSYYIGKWHLYGNEFGNHHDPKNSHIPPGPHRLGFDGFWAAYNFHHTYYNAYYHRDTSERVYVEEYEPDGQTALAIEMLQHATRIGKPFAMFVSYGTPHDPWGVDNVPAEYLERFRDVEFQFPPNYKPENDPYADDWAKLSPDDRVMLGDWMRVYYAMIANLDWNIGRLIDAVDQLGLRDNTIVVFTSDHGEMFGAQGRRGKNIFFDEAVRVPFVVRWPGRIPADRVSDVCLNSPDIMPTLLSLLGLPIPSGVDGMDLSHCVLGQDGAEPEAALLQGMGSVAIWEDGFEWRGLRSKQHTYAVFRSDGREFLYDNHTDPYQTQNLANNPNHAETLEHFRGMLKVCLDELNDNFAASGWYRNHWTRNREIIRSATADWT